MPQLVKGGKYVYGLVKISGTGIIIIPPEAMEEYRFKDGDRVIIMSGSRKSGGFGITKSSILQKTNLAGIIQDIPGLASYQIPENETKENKGRWLCWSTVKTGGYIQLPVKTLLKYGAKPGNLLAIGRGSNLALAFIARGVILEEALKHPELELFETRQEK
jgi:bifunctional DNA-binding transcriptional regulator/antitoxin component of YhaV-PrlF toxin-antitoxin module